MTDRRRRSGLAAHALYHLAVVAGLVACAARSRTRGDALVWSLLAVLVTVVVGQEWARRLFRSGGPR